MRAEIISIGTELVTGSNLDTNAQWLSRALSSIGVQVRFHVTVGDDFVENIATLKLAIERSDLVVVTGGLGPTADDLTRAALADVAGVKLVEDADSLAVIRAMFARRNRPMPERNVVQALFPEGATPIPNRHGTAPGIWMEVGAAVVVCLPGVPREMYGMYEEEIAPRLEAKFGGGRATAFHTLKVYGLGESHVE